MLNRAVGLGILCLLGVALSAPASAEADFAIERFKRVPFVMGHRACWGPEIPENSMRGIQACVKHGVDMIEVDIHRTRDDVLVLIHDDTLDRTTDGTGPVSELTYEQLQAVRLRMGAGGPDARVGTDSIPTLAAALRAIRGKAVLFLDMKIQSERDRRDVLDLVTRENAREYVAMYAFFPGDRAAQLQVPEWVRRHSIYPVVEQGAIPDRKTLWHATLADAVREYGDLQPLAFMVFIKSADFLRTNPPDSHIPRLASPIFGLAGQRDEGMEARLAGNPQYIWGDLLDAGATGFMTNHPLELLEFAKRSTTASPPIAPARRHRSRARSPS